MSRGARSDRARPDLEPVRLEDDARRAARAPARAARGRRLDRERGAGPLRAHLVRRPAAGSRGGAGADRREAGDRRRVRRSRVSRRGTWTAAGAAAVLLALSFYTLVSWLERGQLSDVPVYLHYSHLVRSGAVPYRDFKFEYPPAALPALLLPAYMTWSYATSFAVLMGACGAGCIAAAASALRAVGASAARRWVGLLAIGVSPVVLGSLFDTRFDLWPALLAVGALATTVR